MFSDFEHLQTSKAFKTISNQPESMTSLIIPQTANLTHQISIQEDQ